MGGTVVFGLAFALTAVACYDPMIDDGKLICLSSIDCPPGFFCAAPCGTCYHDTPAGHKLALTCSIEVHGGTGGGTGDGSGAGGAGGGGGQTGAGGGVIVGGGGAGTGGTGGGTAAGGHGGTIVGGSGGRLGAAGMTGAAGATGIGGTTGGIGGRTGAGGVIVGGSGGAPGAGGAIVSGSGGAPGAGGKIGAGGAMGLGGAMMGTGGAPALGLGSKCSVGTQCASTFCVDGFCCNSACAGQCQACDITPGSCSLVTSGPVHGTRPVCGGSGICGAQCTLTTAVTAACLFAPMTTSCGPQTCKGSMLTLAQFCDGSGNCTPGVSGPCPAGLKCNADQTACLASCATNADCNAPAPNCNLTTHQCTAAGPMGSPCSLDGDCQNGLCVDKFCCSEPCTSQCMACDVSGHQGQCFAVPAGQQPHSARGPCGGAAECQGRCDGSSPSCQFPGAETSCVCPGLIPMTGSCNMAGGCLLLGLLCL